MLVLKPFVQNIGLLDSDAVDPNNISRPMYFNGISMYNLSSTLCKVMKPPFVATCPLVLNNLSYLLTGFALGLSGVFFVDTASTLPFFSPSHFSIVRHPTSPHKKRTKAKTPIKIQYSFSYIQYLNITNIYLAFRKFQIAQPLNTTIKTHKAPIWGNTCLNSLP